MALEAAGVVREALGEIDGCDLETPSPPHAEPPRHNKLTDHPGPEEEHQASADPKKQQLGALILKMF